jgi:hypothetical protein
MDSFTARPIRDFKIARREKYSTELVWTPAEGSVALYDALRKAYPLVQTLPGLMREATMEFFLNEKEDEQRSSIKGPIPSPYISGVDLQPEISRASSSLLHAEDSTASGHKYQQSNDFQRSQGSNYNTAGDWRIKTCRSERYQSPQAPLNKPPASLREDLNSRIITFPLSGGGLKERKAKRSMTEGERIDYSIVRKVKPCAKHKKHKQKVCLDYLQHYTELTLVVLV